MIKYQHLRLITGTTQYLIYGQYFSRVIQQTLIRPNDRTFEFEHILLYTYIKDTYTNGSDTSSENLLGLYHNNFTSTYL